MLWTDMTFPASEMERFNHRPQYTLRAFNAAGWEIASLLYKKFPNDRGSTPNEISIKQWTLMTASPDSEASHAMFGFLRYLFLEAAGRTQAGQCRILVNPLIMKDMARNDMQHMLSPYFDFAVRSDAEQGFESVVTRKTH